ncbi:MAG: class I SAM-dependent methyltransferase [Nanoarchaeota archaeon]|nr:class I SAM-dependent methyltransferase [Nanoarchaeota archaeon]
MKKLNFGCGPDIKKSTKNEKWINMDILKLPGIDVVHDFNKFPYPFKNNEFDVVYTSHVLEHMDDLIKVMKELKRICKPGAKIIIRVPHFSCGVSYRDPTHKRLFSYFTFEYFTEDCFYGLPKFKIVKRKLNFTRLAFPSLNYIFNPLININPALYERFFCWVLPCAECLFELEVVK